MFVGDSLDGAGVDGYNVRYGFALTPLLSSQLFVAIVELALLAGWLSGNNRYDPTGIRRRHALRGATLATSQPTQTRRSKSHVAGVAST
ncbi:hypothetical protein HD598_001993 [Neomicrococcus aestuarii]|uniref:Uncharacterized protein n=1 Tax=Neomicrococcus aestuarii TaxID=556325 RepID=A0A7W8WZF1_9MICC|nr:hypothetical protein [Neomicrococcus aestuarii]